LIRSCVVFALFLASGCAPFHEAFRYVPVHSTVLSNDHPLRAEAGRLGANAVDLRDFRTGGATRPEHADPHWDAVALYCPTGGG
jgi:hypothetical protein